MTLASWVKWNVAHAVAQDVAHRRIQRSDAGESAEDSGGEEKLQDVFLPGGQIAMAVDDRWLSQCRRQQQIVALVEGSEGSGETVRRPSGPKQAFNPWGTRSGTEAAALRGQGGYSGVYRQRGACVWGSPRQLAEQLAAPFGTAISKALRRHVAHRTQSAMELWTDLNATESPLAQAPRAHIEQSAPVPQLEAPPETG